MITLMLGGDVMTGRGIDQVLPHPSDPVLYESFVKSARDYVTIAERANGTIPKPVAFDYIWGDALAALDQRKPDVRIVNLETAVTTADRPWPKGINYRMHPANVPCLTAARIDCCVLANNHVMDWGEDGLVETIAVLKGAGMAIAGAGIDLERAAAPAILPVAGRGRVLVLALGAPSSGIPSEWAAAADRPGVAFLPEPSEAAVEMVAARLGRVRKPGDIAVCSIHTGPNWGYEIDPTDRTFAHRLIEHAGVDIVHCHSSHHPKAIEVHRGKPILHGCGDFLNDYEGIGDHEPYEGDLVLAYLVSIDDGGDMAGIDLLPFRIRKFRLERPEAADRELLLAIVDHECRRFGRGVLPSRSGSYPVFRLDLGLARGRG
jgi:poly-gamma-glutamate synthesis protein (capsule biosynthesis protein)